MENIILTVETTVNAPVERVWNLWTEPRHITQWNHAIDEWHSPAAENDLRVGGRFSFRMEAKDGSMGFDFKGVYNEVETYKKIVYTLDDDRQVTVNFNADGNQTTITESFEAEQTHSIEMQQGGWQAILDNFKLYAESLGTWEKLHFEIEINADVEKVYKTMLDEKTYPVWTAEFNPTSHYKGSWDKNSKILFLGTDEQGKQGGMVSRVRENVVNKYVSVEHLGIVQDDTEITKGPEVDGWAGALENYSFKQIDGHTVLSIDMDANEQFKSYFLETWPRALNKLKSMCEN